MEMAFNPLTERGIPIERQFRNWSELAGQPFNTHDVHPYTRCRVILMNGVEVEAIINSHNAARRIADTGLKQMLAMVRRVEQQQQKQVNWLIPGSESVIANTIGYEQVAVDLTSWVARHEPDPYLTQVYEFGVLEDYDHLYRYANLMDLMGERRKAEEITGDFTEILPGRPTIFHHRHPLDELRRPMTIEASQFQSILNALTVVSAEQQTMNWYMNIGNRPEHPLARSLYLEIAQVEEQHVSHYESILDPTMPELLNLALHEYNECWLYWSCMETETDPRIRQIWELHLGMELEHLRIACEAMKEVDGIDAADLFPKGGVADPMTFEPNKQYVRDVLARTVEWSSWDSEFVPVTELPADHRFFQFQRVVNEGGVPSEQVIEEHREKFGGEYRLSTEGEHPIPALRDSGTCEGTTYAKAEERVMMEPAE
jgi:rubrerythrin